MKKTLGLIALAGIASFFFGGCADSQIKLNKIEESRKAMLQSEKNYMAAKTTPESKYMSKRVSGSFKKTPVYVAVKRIAKKAGIPFDTTFAPSRDYRVTALFNGTVGEFLTIAKQQSGVDYRFRNGRLSVFNKEYIEKEYRPASCHDKASKRIRVSLRSVPPKQVFDYFAENAGYSITYDDKYFNVSGNKVSLRQVSPVDFSYNGCDSREALFKFGKANDLDVAFTGGKNITVKDYKTVQLDIPTYFKSDFQSDSSGVGEDSTQSGNKLSESVDYKKEMEELIATYLSPVGKAVYSNRGFVTITDVPSSVNNLRKVISKEVNAQEGIDLSVSIIRIDVNDNYSQGIDWSAAMSQIGKSLGIRNLTMGLNYADNASGGLSVGGIVNNKQQLINLLGEYGKAKIVRDYNAKTRSGMLTTFSAVQKIPYVTTSVIQDGQTSQTVAEAKSVDAGIILNVKPTLTQGGEVVNFAIDITVSEYLGEKVFKVNGDDFRLPEISSNHLQMPASSKMNESIILTGLKLRTNTTNKNGIPEVSKNPIVGGLFGSEEQDASTSEFIIVLSPKQRRG